MPAPHILVRLFGIGAQAQDVAVRIFYVDFQRPRKILWGHADFDALAFEFFVKLFGVFYADPDPGSAASLIAATEEQAGAIAKSRLQDFETRVLIAES